MGDEHFCVPMGDGSFAMVDCFGTGTKWVISTSRGDVHFSWSDRFGPLPLHKSGAVRELHHNHPFWLNASLWNLQGRRVEEGKAIWHAPRQPIYRVTPQKEIIFTDAGEEGWDWMPKGIRSPLAEMPVVAARRRPAKRKVSP